MKFCAALVALLFLTVPSQAQIPVYGPYPFMQPYYPGAYAYPYYPQAYYPQPYGMETYVANESIISNNSDAVDTLTRRVEDLTEQVKMLEAQLTVAQAQPQPPVVEPPREPSVPMVLVLKSGKQIETQGYAIAGDTLWVLSSSGS